MPTLDTEIYQRYRDRGLVGWAVSSSTLGPADPDDLAAYVDGLGLTMPVLLDVNGEMYADYEITVPGGFAPYPREYLIDRDGTVLYASPNIDTDAIATVLEQHL